MPAPRAGAAKPVRLVDLATRRRHRATIASSRDWDAVIRLLAGTRRRVLDAEGQMTDAVLADVSRVETRHRRSNLGGSKALTDEGVRHLARLPRAEASRPERHGDHRSRTRGAARPARARDGLARR